MDTEADPELRRITRFWDARAREDALRYSVPGGAAVDEDAFGRSGGEVLDAIAALLRWSVEGAEMVLDLGCGAGRLTGPIADRADDVLAVDVSEGMLGVARDRLGAAGNVEWLASDAADLDRVGPESCDAAIALGLLPHLPTVKHVAAVIDELGRVLRAGSSAIFDVRTAPEPIALPGETTLPAHVTGHPLWHGVAVDLETLASLALTAELDLERIEGSGSARALVLARRIEE